MRYYSIYKEKDFDELQGILSKPSTLSYEAQVDLKKAIIDLDHKFDNLYSLENSLNQAENAIENFYYLKNLGFKIEHGAGYFKVKRDLTGLLVDWIGSILGLLLSFSLLASSQLWIDVFTKELTLGSLVMAVITLVIGLLGLMLFVRAFSRIYEYRGFQIIRNQSGVIVHKKSEKLSESLLTTDQKLSLQKNEEAWAIQIKQDDGSMIDLLKAKGGTRVRLTLEKLYNKLVTNFD